MMEFYRDEYVFKDTPSKQSEKNPYNLHIWSLYNFIGGYQYLTCLPKKDCPNFFLAKVWLKNTLPTYNLDICPNFPLF